MVNSAHPSPRHKPFGDLCRLAPSSPPLLSHPGFLGILAWKISYFIAEVEYPMTHPRFPVSSVTSQLEPSITARNGVAVAHRAPCTRWGSATLSTWLLRKILQSIILALCTIKFGFFRTRFFSGAATCNSRTLSGVIRKACARRTLEIPTSILVLCLKRARGRHSIPGSERPIILTRSLRPSRRVIHKKGPYLLS